MDNMDSFDSTTAVDGEEGFDGFENDESLTDSEGEAGFEAPSAPKAAPKAPQAPDLRAMKFKLANPDGSHRIVDIDTLIAAARKAEHLERAYGTHAEKAKAADQIMSRLKEADVLDLLKERGLKGAELKSYLQDKYLELLEDESKTPEQRELEEYRKREAERKRQEEEKSKTEQQKAYERQVAEASEKLTKDFGDAFQGSAMPKEPLFLKWAVQEYLGAKKVGYDITPAEAVKYTENRVLESVGQVLQNANIEFVESLLGPKVLQALRAKSVAKLKQQQQAGIAGGASPAPTTTNDNNRQQQSDKQAAPQRASRSARQPQSMNAFFRGLAK